MIDYFAKFKRGVDFMDGNEKGDLHELCNGEKLKITNIGFMNGDNGEYAVFMVDSIPGVFYYGNSVVSEMLLQIREDGMIEALKEINVAFREVTSKKNRTYVTIDFVD